MDYFEKLNDFADGTLDIEKEDDFYMRLSNDEELKSNLKNLLLMKSTLSRNENYFNPTSKATIGIFSTLGIAVPAGTIEQAPINPNSGSKLSNFIRVHKQGIISGIISSIATFIIVYFLMSHFHGNENKYMQTAQVKQSEKNTVPLIQNFEGTNKNGKSQINEINQTNAKPLIKYIYIHDNANNSELIDNNKIINNSDNIVNILNSPISKTEKSSLLSHNLDGPKPITGIKNNKMLFSFIPNNDIFVELRNMIVFNIPQPTISPNRYSEFNNLALTVFYEITDNGKVGLECRQETFFQKYKGTDLQGVNNIYEQQPNFTTVSLAYRYNFLNQNEYSLFGQLQLGGNIVGYVGRIMAGASYNAYDDLIFVAGIEYSNLYYRYQKQGFSSSKLGLNYGINYKF
jgi:hypothetical protein